MKDVAPPLSQARMRSLSLTDALVVAEWLNAAKGTKARTHVLGIRTHLEYLREMVDTGRAGEPEFRLRHNHVNELLSHYTFHPVLSYDLPSGVWRYNAVPKNARGRTVEVTHQGVTVQVNAAAVVAALARLAARGELRKARLCEWCKENYRVSERDMDRFCSDRCRNADYQARPEFKASRKRIQKDWRARENEKDARARAQVQLKGRK
jgi:hypothetical protein